MRNNYKIKKIKKKLEELKPLLKEKFKVKEIAIFGSYLRREQKRGSDLDILVEFYEPIGFFKFINLEDLLSRELGIKVDLVLKNALKPFIKERILKETIYL